MPCCPCSSAESIVAAAESIVAAEPIVAAAEPIVAVAVTIEESGSLGRSLVRLGSKLPHPRAPGSYSLGLEDVGPYCQRSAVARELAPFSNC